jgi:hypothetical protein
MGRASHRKREARLIAREASVLAPLAAAPERRRNGFLVHYWKKAKKHCLDMDHFQHPCARMLGHSRLAIYRQQGCNHHGACPW